MSNKPNPDPSAGTAQAARRLLPLTVWLCTDNADNADQDGSVLAVPCCPRLPSVVGYALAEHLIAACTQRGDLIVEVDAGSETTVAAAAIEGRRAIALVPHRPLAQAIAARLRDMFPAERLAQVALCPAKPNRLYSALAGYAAGAALVILAPPCSKATGCPLCRRIPDYGPRDEQAIWMAAWRLLRDGGHVAVITSRHRHRGRLCDPAPQAIGDAQRTGFGYTQHVIALRVPIRDGELVVQAGPDCLAQVRDDWQTRIPATVTVHADVLIFTKPVAGGR